VSGMSKNPTSMWAEWTSVESKNVSIAELMVPLETSEGSRSGAVSGGYGSERKKRKAPLKIVYQATTSTSVSRDTAPFPSVRGFPFRTATTDSGKHGVLASIML
jgi:hypothetical protein